MSDEFAVVAGAHEQAMALTKEEMKEITYTEEVVEASLTSGSPDIALNYLYTLRRGGQVKGLAAAKLLYLLREHWAEFQTDDMFQDAVLKATGFSNETVGKYVRLWESVFANPQVNDAIKALLMGKPIGSLLLLTAAAREGDLDEAAWQEAAEAVDKNEMREIIQEARGLQTSASSSLVIVLDREGRLKVRKGQGHYTAFGLLPKPTNDIASAAIERIIRAAGIVRLGVD